MVKAEPEDDATQVCEAEECARDVRRPRFYCAGHWSFVPSHEREAIFEAWVSGNGRVLETVLDRVTEYIADVEKRRKRP